MKCLEFKGANKSQETVNYSDQHCNNILDSGGDKVSRDITLNCADTCQDMLLHDSDHQDEVYVETIFILIKSS